MAMDELTIDGKTYLSSKQAAKVTGYAKDYIGQLCREGRVEAKLVGRSWYVYEPSLKEHRFNDERVKQKNRSRSVDAAANATKDEGVPSQAERQTAQVEVSDISNIEAVWEQPAYISETVTPLPAFEKKNERQSSEDTSQATLSEMQAAWQDWFATREHHSSAGLKESKVDLEVAQIREEEAPAEVTITRKEPSILIEGQNRPILSDIQPIESIKHAESTPKISRVHMRTQHLMHTKGQRQPIPTILKASVTALVVFSVSVTLVATGLIDALHIGGLTDTPIVRFLQGSQVVEK